ncbi:MAG TPA: type II toxin-antitoxin system HicB family antitoxin [Solirubrobacterales bacterium]|nr:type II toxin-antitoxin system HicB family antitoxin [Solirubrobacterales bacterium]
MTERLTLTAVYEPAEEGWIAARVLEVPGINTCGRSIDEARDMVKDAVLLMLEHELQRGDTGPPLPHAVTEELEIVVD